MCFCVQKLGQLLAEFVQTFRPAAKMVSIAGLLCHINILHVFILEYYCNGQKHGHFLHITFGDCSHSI